MKLTIDAKTFGCTVDGKDGIATVRMTLANGRRVLLTMAEEDYNNLTAPTSKPTTLADLGQRIKETSSEQKLTKMKEKLKAEQALIKEKESTDNFLLNIPGIKLSTENEKANLNLKDIDNAVSAIVDAIINGKTDNRPALFYGSILATLNVLADKKKLTDAYHLLMNHFPEHNASLL